MHMELILDVELQLQTPPTEIIFKCSKIISKQA